MKLSCVDSGLTCGTPGVGDFDISLYANQKNMSFVQRDYDFSYLRGAVRRNMVIPLLDKECAGAHPRILSA